MKYIAISKFAGSMIRHGATLIGGYLVAEGWTDENTAQQIVGGLTAAGGLALSLLEKKARI
ncbi:Pam3-gp28 family putative phage holin [Tritonibacter mobilis]|uniref:Pam3-gp28 family putative phage holin n=1 Tax=Tritonibacter mobilis TaxID=379347 RepID=UPI0008068951|nr:hypothetical protein [Tritonibacter mobilis]